MGAFIKACGVIACAAMALCLLLVGLTSVRAGAADNSNTCRTGLQPVGNGVKGPGSPGAGPVFEGDKKEAGAFQITVPLKPEGPQKSAQWGSDRVRNAATITNVARTMKLSPRAAVIAIATAMQESSLDNLKGGDADSVGLFQQRPSQGWGTPAQLRDPIFASKNFYERLVKVDRWQTKPLTKVAAAVQRPLEAYRGEYAKWEQAAGALVARTWGDHAVTSISTGCEAASGSGGARIGSGGKLGKDSKANFPKSNRRTPQQAIKAARQMDGDYGWRRLCEKFVEVAYGTEFVHASANTHWRTAVSRGFAHPGNAQPPPGALLFYDTGDDAGHVALYLGNDQVASNDILARGRIDIVSRKELTDGKWRLRYRGWAEPRFP